MMVIESLIESILRESKYIFFECVQRRPADVGLCVIQQLQIGQGEKMTEKEEVQFFPDHTVCTSTSVIVLNSHFSCLWFLQDEIELEFYEA